MEWSRKCSGVITELSRKKRVSSIAAFLHSFSPRNGKHEGFPKLHWRGVCTRPETIIKAVKKGNETAQWMTDSGGKETVLVALYPLFLLESWAQVKRLKWNKVGMLMLVVSQCPMPISHITKAGLSISNKNKCRHPEAFNLVYVFPLQKGNILMTHNSHELN